MNKRIIDYLQSVEISHSFAMKYNHGVQSINADGKWDLFEPTRFVYAFFALNMIYSAYDSTLTLNIGSPSKRPENSMRLQM